MPIARLLTVSGAGTKIYAPPAQSTIAPRAMASLARVDNVRARETSSPNFAVCETPLNSPFSRDASRVDGAERMV